MIDEGLAESHIVEYSVLIMDVVQTSVVECDTLKHLTCEHY